MRNIGEVFKLWEKDIPFATADDAKKQEHFNDSDDGLERITDVTVPTISFYPATGLGPKPAVLVCPGGGYRILAWTHEGLDICSVLNAAGFTAFLLKYRCPDCRVAAHADIARAMRFIRANAKKFDIDANRLGGIGFSAGAHLLATITAPTDSEPYPPKDEIDEQNFRSDYSALIYPAYLSDDDLNLAPEFKVDKDTAPCFLVQAQDDCIRLENSLAWTWAMKKVGAPVETHIFSEGGHGYGIKRSGLPVADWPELAVKWFRRVTKSL